MIIVVSILRQTIQYFVFVIQINQIKNYIPSQSTNGDDDQITFIVLWLGLTCDKRSKDLSKGPTFHFGVSMPPYVSNINPLSSI